MSLEGKIKKGWRLIRRGELFDALRRISHLTMPRRHVFLEQTLVLHCDGVPQGGASASHDVQFREADASDLDGLLRCSCCPPGSREEQGFRKYFEKGRKCFVLAEGTEILAYCWAFFERYSVPQDQGEVSEIILRLPPGVAAIGDAFVQPDHRRRGLYSELLRSAIGFMRRTQGMIGTIVGVKTSNEPSVAAHMRNGFKRVATVSYVRVGQRGFFHVREEGSPPVWYRSRPVPEISIRGLRSGGAEIAPASVAESQPR